ncbi:hypothetical protein ANN_10758 [Periplaneta americana]|uniref:Uncharacterized protein n=1 Tax=Periplaneta americana TaxID=6978 RepID=A0ABQ8T5F6_PERAM|nr:hypothetical protein ANN_10758 [Periplaneta americana]
MGPLHPPPYVHTANVTKQYRIHSDSPSKTLKRPRKCSKKKLTPVRVSKQFTFLSLLELPYVSQLKIGKCLESLLGYDKVWHVDAMLVWKSMDVCSSTCSSDETVKQWIHTDNLTLKPMSVVRRCVFESDVSILQLRYLFDVLSQPDYLTPFHSGLEGTDGDPKENRCGSEREKTVQ